MFNFNINEYSFEDMKKVFGISDNETMTDNELDVRIASILFNAKSQLSKQELSKVKSFLPILKEKYKQLVQLNNIEINNIHPLTESMKAIMRPNTFLDKNEHMVIEKTTEPEYTIRNFSIYSCDRDTSIFPYASQFEVDVPTDIRDITLLQLQDYNMSFDKKNISSWYQNTKLTFSVQGIIPVSSDGNSSNISINDNMTITIEDGFYIDETILLNELKDKMNSKLYNMILNIDANIDTIDSSPIGNLSNGNSTFSFKIQYSTLKHKIVIYNEKLEFKLHFNLPDEFENNKYQTKKVYNLKNYWGLGYVLGFNKELYKSESIKISNSYGGDVSKPVNLIYAPRIIDINLNAIAYLEIDGFNYSYQTNEYQGEVNSYFARIPIGYTKDQIRISDTGGFDKAVVSYERINKLKIKLRLFNGILLDIEDENFDISLAFYCKK